MLSPKQSYIKAVRKQSLSHVINIEYAIIAERQRVFRVEIVEMMMLTRRDGRRRNETQASIKWNFGDCLSFRDRSEPTHIYANFYNNKLEFEQNNQ